MISVTLGVASVKAGLVLKVVVTVLDAAAETSEVEQAYDGQRARLLVFGLVHASDVTVPVM